MSSLIVLAASTALLDSTFGKVLGVVLVAAAAGLAAFGILALVVKRDSAVDSRLARYSAEPARHDEATGSSLITTAVLRRALAVTTKLAERNDLLSRVESDLERANLPIRAPEIVLVSVIAAITAAALVMAATKLVFLALLTLLLAGAAPAAVVRVIGARNRQKFVSQLPDTLNLLAGSLRSGVSFLQAVEGVSVQLDGPMAKELRRIITEGRLGRQLEDSMEETARRMGSEDFDWVVMAVRVQREVGGNLAEVLTSVADTMVQRDRLRREVKTLTAEGRITMVILGIMPVALGLFIYAVNPGYMGVLFHETTGRIMTAGAVVLAIAGVWWMRKTLEIEL